MGNVCGPMDEDQARSRQLDRMMKVDAKKEASIIKLLLLGTGESGKSTIVKQMKILEALEAQATAQKKGKDPARSDGFSEEDRKAATNHIRNNTMDSMVSLLMAISTLPDLQNSLEGEAVLESKRKVLEAIEVGGGGERYTPELASAVKLLWEQAVTQECMKRKHEFQLLDSAPYFLAQAELIGDPEFVPTDQDIVRARSMTTGIVVVPFQVKKHKFEMVDVGGQRSERKKWIHQFDKVTAVMFIIAMSEYDQNLFEDESMNRMQESEKVFKEMLNNIFFQSTDFIVFFNKADLFKEKLAVSPISKAYPDYTGKQEYDEAKKFYRFQVRSAQ